MYELGKKSEVEDEKVTDLVVIPGIWERPSRMPSVSSEEVVIGGANQGRGERLFVCESLVDMQRLFDADAEGMTIAPITWYRGKVQEQESVTGHMIDPDVNIARSVIDRYAPNAPNVVKEAIVAYAMGNPGTAKALAQRAVDFTSAEQVEKLVGWNLSQHHQRRANEIWERFSDR